MTRDTVTAKDLLTALDARDTNRGIKPREGYVIREIFLSVQGEGHRTGTANVFVRFAGCNLQCSVEREGFNCDTDFQHGERMSLDRILQVVKMLAFSKGNHPVRSVILTGGEPTLQVNAPLIYALKNLGYYLAIETNGLLAPPKGIDWISCSPKPLTRPILDFANEVRCVVKAGQIPDAKGIQATHYFVSPACKAPTADAIRGFLGSKDDLDREALDWVVGWVLGHPDWRISLQTHKLLGVR